MKKFLIFLVILSLVLVSCENETTAPVTNTGGNQQGSTPAAPATQQQQTATTTVPQSQTETNPEQKLLDNIDWDSIHNDTILLLVSEFGVVEYVDFNKGNELRIFTPSQKDFLKFINNYDSEITTLTENGKTIYILKETGKKSAPVSNGLSLLPPNVQEAFGNLLGDYPSPLFKPGNAVDSGHGSGGCGTIC